MHKIKIVFVSALSMPLCGMEVAPSKQINKAPLLVWWYDKQRKVQEFPSSYFITYERSAEEKYSLLLQKNNPIPVKCKTKYINEAHNKTTVGNSEEFVALYKKFIDKNPRLAQVPMQVSKYNKFHNSYEVSQTFSSDDIQKLFTQTYISSTKIAQCKDAVKAAYKDKSSYISLLPRDILLHLENFLCNSTNACEKWGYLEPLFEYHEQVMREISRVKKLN